MGAEGPFLEKLSEYLLSLPTDLKVLQEAVTDPDMDRDVREMAAGTIIHTILPQEGDSPGRYVDDVLLVRAAFAKIATNKSDGAQAFVGRFAEVYEKLDDDVKIFGAVLGDLWPWIESKLPTFSKQVFKGKKPAQYLEDEEAMSFLYDEGLEFETNYPVKEDQVKNKIRRVESILELLNKKRAEEAKKKV